jgi:hypothetical protein
LASKLKKLSLIVLLSIVLTIASIFYFYKPRFITSDKGLDFLANVAGLDVAHYNVRVRNGTVVPAADYTVKYELTFGDDKIDVLVNMRNGEVVWCKLYPIKGSPVFTESPSTNSIIGAKNLLERLRTYFADSYLPTMPEEMLKLNIGRDIQSWTLAKPAGTNLTLTLRIEYGSDYNFMWSCTPNGIEDIHKAVYLKTENGEFRFYSNNYDFYQIGNADGYLNREQAIQIAKEQAMKKFSLQPEQIIDRSAMATLSMQDKGNFTLYPCWNIRMPLDKAYGAIGGMHVILWADTGHVAYCQGV